MSRPVNKQEKVNPTAYLNTEHQKRKHCIAKYLNSKNPTAYGNKDNGFCNFKYKTSGLHALSLILTKMETKTSLQPKTL